MSTEVTLKAERRDSTGKGAARKLRDGGRIPAVLYGKGSDSVSLTLSTHEAELLFQAISVENTIIALQIEGEGAVPSLVREIQVHPFKPALVHVDFYRVRAGEMLDMQVPVHLVGTPVGVRDSDGVLQQTVHEIMIRCLPTRIPSSIDVDVSGMDVGDSLHLSDVTLGEGVEALTEVDLTICSVSAPRVAEVDEVDEEAEEEAEDAQGAEEGEEEE